MCNTELLLSEEFKITNRFLDCRCEILYCFTKRLLSDSHTETSIKYTKLTIRLLQKLNELLKEGMYKLF